jgi:uncharacterized SAM-binding protein YcdF (DUF218 family)
MNRDLRKYARQTNIRLFLGFLILLLLVGDGLIYVIYGPQAAVLGVVCILAGLAPLVLIWAVLMLLEFIVRRSKEDN